MEIFFHKNQMLYSPKNEFSSGNQLRKYVESPNRIELIIEEIVNLKRDDFIFKQPKLCNIEIINNIHSTDYINFLKEIPDNINEVAPTAFAFPKGRISKDSTFHAKMGYYLFDPSTPITKDVYQSSHYSTSSALDAVNSLSNNNLAVSLSRPPGHHAMTSVGGGYCFFNNIAIAAQQIVNQGKNVTILDLDFHHGNGTQEIFYNTDKVQFISLHGDTIVNYPFYWGGTDEIGEGDGKGFNLNFPLPNYANDEKYDETLELALIEIDEYNPDVVLVSMGLDCYFKDPIAGMNISLDYYTKIGERLAKFEKMGIILEGGYSNDIGICFTNVLKGVIT